MKTPLSLALCAATLVGCASHTPLQTERSYSVEWIGERPLIDRSHLTMTFGADGRAYGHAGCNHWFAQYTLKGEQLGFDFPGSTRKSCAPALMEQERRFLDALGTVRRWDVSEQDELRLWPASGEPLRLLPER
ncbi:MULTISPECIES: META domain-containing protein [Pseudomonas]|uniref:META domain-containing protein n=1 Tax=Pseudomonas TaxID=286 RepID=UPI00257EA0A2|nr:MULTISPECIES: META domain-containing protein [Pseudomonas]